MIRKYSSALLFILFIQVSGCSSQGNSSNVERRTFAIQIDTVKIDLGDKLLGSSMGLTSMDLEKNALLSFNSYNHSVERIDFDPVRLVDILNFEIEGPNGLGKPIYDFEVLDNQKLFFRAPTSVLTTNWESEVLSSINLLGQESLENLYVTTACSLEKGTGDYYCIYDSLNIRNRGIVKVDINENSFSKYSIDSLKYFKKFDFDNIQFRPEIKFLREILIVSHPFTNEFLIVDPYVSIEHKFFKSELTKNAKRFADNINTDLGELFKSIRSQVSFYPPMYDETRDIFLRISIKPKTPTSEGKSLVVVSVFDSGFNFIGEVSAQMAGSVGVHFLYDGRVYFPQVMSDTEEPYFLVMNVS